jgi:hypothetical protein
MPRLMVKHSVTVMRDGQRITPEIGKAFDFTDAEVADMDKAEPVPYRAIVNEDQGEEAPMTDTLRSVANRPKKAPKEESTSRDGKTPRVGSVTTPGGGTDEDTL